MEGRGGGEAQGVADPKNMSKNSQCASTFYVQAVLPDFPGTTYQNGEKYTK
jgi:hypothetical protein